MTLPRFFALILGALALLAGLVLTLAVRTAGQAVIRTGEAARVARATQVAAAIEGDLSVAERAVEDFEQALANGILDARDPTSVRRYLTAELIAQRNLTDLTLTSGQLNRYGEEGGAVLTAQGRWQASAFRDNTRKIDQRLVDNIVPDGESDPTLHDTFRAAANRDARGRALWSDLSFTELDAALPLERRRKVMTVQKAIFASNGTSAGRFVGVLRAGLVSDTLDRIGASAPAGDPHRIFICDTAGRLLTRLSPGDAHVVVNQEGQPDPDGDLRVVPATAPPPSIAAALAFAREGGMGGKRMVVSGLPYFLTLFPVAEGKAQQWLVGVVVPESYYVGTLAASRDRLLALLAFVVVGIAMAGAFGARTVGRGVHALVGSTEAMRRFSFEASSGMVGSPFAEIRRALESVERAKTALRAMVKYVPVDLVRRLYESGRDPVLGAESMEVSLMFTDIADFTTHAESLAPDQLAQALGRYLEVATNAVEHFGGTVDKYIGDALMVLWNAPEPLADHPAAACRAALACAAATRALGASDWWRSAGLPPWHTRFGLHTARVLVGNFGAPDRMSYTAMGDGVNLAARLEGLNKVYGTTILVSDEVRCRAGDGFVFRRLDRVAVKGKTHPVDVHELVGHAGDLAVEAQRPAIALHERALGAAFEGRFTDALALLRDGDVTGDSATQLLASRCRAWIVDPPPAGWDGTWTATTK